MQTSLLTAAQANRGFLLHCHVQLNSTELYYVASIQQCWLTTRAVVTTEDIDEGLVSQEPLLLVPEELSMSTNLAKQQLAPLLEAAKLPSLEAIHSPAHGACIMFGSCCPEAIACSFL